MSGDTTRRGAGAARHRERPQILICNALASSANPIHHGPHHAGFFIATSQRQAGYCLSVREALRGRAWQGWAWLGAARQGKGWKQ